jgi:cell division septum initiation protein DivIVA
LPAAALVVVALVSVAPGLAADRQPKPNGLHSLWSRFPLDQAQRGAKQTTTVAVTTTTSSPQTPRRHALVPPSSTPRPVQPPAHGGSSGRNPLWLIALAALFAAGAVAWRLTRRPPPARPATVERVKPAAPVAQAAPVPSVAPAGHAGDAGVLLEDAPSRRASTAVRVRRLMETHLFEGSDRMNFRSRGDGAANADGGRATHPSYDAIGDRITSLLESAEDAADGIRKAAKQEAEDLRADAERYSVEMRRRSDAEAAEKRAEAGAEADRIVREAEQRAVRIEQGAIEHRRNVVAEAKAVQHLLDERRRWLQEMIGAFRDVTGRLEAVVESTSEDVAEAPLRRQVTDRREVSDEDSLAEAVEAAPR